MVAVRAGGEAVRGFDARGQTPDVMQRARLARGGRGEADDAPLGPFASAAVRDRDAVDAIRVAGARSYVMRDEHQARALLNGLRALGWDVTKQCGGGS